MAEVSQRDADLRGTPHFRPIWRFWRVRFREFRFWNNKNDFRPKNRENVFQRLWPKLVLSGCFSVLANSENDFFFLKLNSLETESRWISVLNSRCEKINELMLNSKSPKSLEFLITFQSGDLLIIQNACMNHHFCAKICMFVLSWELWKELSLFEWLSMGIWVHWGF